MPLACRVQHAQWSWLWVDRAGDTVKQSQRRVTSPTVIEACLLTIRSKMFRQHLKCSSTAPRRAGTSSGFFLFVSFYSASCLSLGELVQRCLGQIVDLLAPWPSTAVIPRRRSTVVHIQSVELRVQRNLEGLANVHLDELTVVRRHWLFFFFQCLRGEGEDSERGETKFSAGVPVTAPTTMHAEGRQCECSQRHHFKVARAGWRHGVTVAMVIKWRPYSQNGSVRKRMICFWLSILLKRWKVFFFDSLLPLYRQKSLQNWRIDLERAPF